MKVLTLSIDELFNDFPYTKYDIGGMGHYIQIKPEDKGKVIEEMVNEYKELLEQSFYEEEDEEDE